MTTREKLTSTLSGAIFFLVLFLVLTTIISIFLTILSIVLSAVFFMAMVGFTVMLVTTIINVLNGTNTNQSNDNQQRNKDYQDMSQEDRIEILKEKYLNGQISEEEFEKMIDRELNRKKEKNVQFNNQRNIF
jgi:uncharacterized membrane protein